jgi:hypothetical protein
MAVKATENQIIQQKKSKNNNMNLLKVHRKIWQHAQRFLGSQQTYDEIFIKDTGLSISLFKLN